MSYIVCRESEKLKVKSAKPKCKMQNCGGPFGIAQGRFYGRSFDFGFLLASRQGNYTEILGLFSVETDPTMLSAGVDPAAWALLLGCGDVEKKVLVLRICRTGLGRFRWGFESVLKKSPIICEKYPL